MAMFYFVDSNGGRSWKLRANSESAAWKRLAEAEDESVARTKDAYFIAYPDRGAMSLFEDLSEHEKAVKVLTRSRSSSRRRV